MPKPNLDAHGFKKPPSQPAVCPFPDSSMSAVKAKWSVPDTGSTLNAITKKFYTLPSEMTADLKVPVVDALAVVLYSGVVLSMDGDNVLKDTVDHKNEAVLKRAHEASPLNRCGKGFVVFFGEHCSGRACR